MLEVQSPVELWLQMVDVVGFGVGSIWENAYTPCHHKMQPVWQLIATVTCRPQQLVSFEKFETQSCITQPVSLQSETDYWLSSCMRHVAAEIKTDLSGMC